MKTINQRITYFYAFLCALALTLFAFYLQFWKGLMPCPLCVLQRVVLVILGIIFLIGSLVGLKKVNNILIGALAFLFSIIGTCLAARQVWLQNLPPNQNVDCGVSLQYMLQVLPLDQVLKKTLQGTAECSLVDWSLGGLSMAQWSLMGFIIFAVFSLWQILKPRFQH